MKKTDFRQISFSGQI